MSDESSQTVVSAGRISSILRPSSAASDSREDTISALSTDSFEVWVLGSKTRISSISSPQKERRKGSLLAKEKMSISEPRTANWPGTPTKSTLSKPEVPRVSIILSKRAVCPFFTVSTAPFMRDAAGIFSSRASGYETMKRRLPLLESIFSRAAVRWTPRVLL